MENNNQKIVRVQKNVVGALSIEFADYRNMATQRFFAINAEQEFLPIPLNYAISMFMIQSTMKAYNQGLWSFNEKDEELVKTMATAEGFYFDTAEWGNDALEQPEVMFTDKQVLGFLVRGRKAEIQQIIDNGSGFQKSMLATVAKDNIEDLKGSMVRLVEEGLGLALVETSE